MTDINSVKVARLLTKFQSISEDEFTEVVVMPLLVKLNYRFVDYHGGKYEIGKDIVCWKDGDFGDRELTVVQVKKTKVSASASAKNNFAEIISQLHQAADEAVPSIHGNTQVPDQVIFITPYAITTRALEMAINGHQRLAARGVKILDGNRVAGLVERHLPKLTAELCGTEFSIVEHAMGNVSNADLLSALNYAKDKRISDFYCDLDFGVGKITTKFFFSLQFEPTSLPEKITASKWIEFSKIIRATEDLLGDCFISPGFQFIEEKYQRDAEKWRSKSNIATIDRIATLTIEVEEAISSLVGNMCQIVAEALDADNKIDRVSALSIARAEPAKLQFDLPVLRALHRKANSLNSKIDEWKRAARSLETEYVDSLEKLLDEVSELLAELRDAGRALSASSENQLSVMFKNYKHLSRTTRDLRKQHLKRIDSPFYEFTIDGAKLAELIEGQKKWLALTLHKVSGGTASKIEVKDFFVRCQSLFEKIGLLLESRLILQAMGIDPTQRFRMGSAERISMPIRDVFNTGINCAVFGEAGAGKSTTLRMFAEQSSLELVDDSTITLFLPLNRVLPAGVKQLDVVEFNALSRLEQGLADYFSSGGKVISVRDLSDFLHSRQRVVFVFDGLDEIIKTSPWIIDAILELEGAYGNAQIILSSRTSGAYIDRIHYLSMTLLPFSDEQVLQFIRGWFISDMPKAELVEQHLNSTPTLRTIVRSPLLATILCVLADNGVPLPNGEIEMYSERMRLLLGHYDIHKKTKRINSSNIILEIAARKLAFHLHARNLRSASIRTLEESAVAISKDQDWGYSPEQVKLAVRELVDPCNILVPMTDDGEFGFDHLRYQEYLAATELVQNRGVSLHPMLSSPWWKSVLVLFARMTDNIHYLFSEILERQGKISLYRETLTAMAMTRNAAERRTLLNLLEKHCKLDALDRDLEEFYDFDHDNNEDYSEITSYR